MTRQSSWPRRNLPLILLLLLPTLILYPLMVTASASATQPTLTQDEQQMLDLINNERALEGLDPLESEARLTKIARYHSQEMINLNYFSHVSPERGSLEKRLTRVGIKNAREQGENIVAASSVELAFVQLMMSPEHKENMLSPSFTHVGIGSRDGGDFGKIITQDFIEESKPATAAEQGAILAGLNFMILGVLGLTRKLVLMLAHGLAHIRPHRPYFVPSP